MKKYLLILSALTAVLACDVISVEESVEHAPVVTSFTPQSGPAGTVVDIQGEYLQDVTEAYIGSVKVDIVSKISSTLLKVEVNQSVTSGKVKLVNTTGDGLSDGDFSATFAVPAITASLLQESAEMGANIMLNGEHLSSATAVYFTAEGHADGHEAVIVTRNADEIIVKVPYVEAENARITLQYFDGSSTVETPLASAPAIKIIRYVPHFNDYSFEKTAVGRSITLAGEYLNNVDRITVGEWDAPIYKSANSLTFTIPAGDFVDGETEVALKAWYFDNNESITLAPDFLVFVPFVKFWENVVAWAQGRVEQNSYASFFSPENGKLYENAKWKTDLDPVAMELHGSQWGSANQPKPGMVSDGQYNSVVPYLFFSAVSGNVLQINSPANSNGQLKNFFTAATGTPANDYRVPGGNDNIPGTPILAFRPLSTANETENALIQKVLADQIDKIDEATFPIDVANSKIAGISVSSFAGGVKSSAFCDHQTATMVDDPGYKLDAVILVAYYNNYGYNAESRASGIRRLGLIHIKQIDWGVYNNSNLGASAVTFDCYWQKYDYDYSKVIL